MIAALKLANPKSYQDVTTFMGDRLAVEIGPHTYAVQRLDYVEVTLHGSTIVMYRPTNYAVSLGGFDTTMTRGRIGKLIPHRLYRDGGTSFVESFEVDHATGKMKPLYTAVPVNGWASIEW